jgi:hypothetical protein
MTTSRKVDRIADSGKKPYVRPELECASVYEATAATTGCCKARPTSCSQSNRRGLGKSERVQNVS